MSHELRTPLNAVLGCTETLLEEVYGPVTKRQRTSLGLVEESGRHLLSLINDILDLSKVEAGMLELELGPVDTRELLESSLRFVKEPAHKKRVVLSISLDEQVGTIVADERRLKQVLVNLLTNAVKFTPEGGAVGLELVGHAEREVVELSVRDTGIGIPREQMPSLFRPFVQLDGGLDRQYEGTGLGLSLVAKLVERHGGSVTVDSAGEGKGSCFTVALSWTPEAQAGGPGEGEAELAESGVRQALVVEDSPTSGDMPLLLLAEDNEANINMTSDYLRSKGYRLAVARNGEEALEQTRELSPDLILMDVQMPKVDGLSATRQIREDPALEPIPIIALTALAMRGDGERILEAGANEYMAKPVSLRDLLEKIETLLHRRAA